MLNTQTPRNPIAGYETEIVASLAAKDVLVLRGPTGSGKSTEIGPMLHWAGYKVVVTQPRRLPAWSIATFVAKLLSVVLGKLVGWRTGDGQMKLIQMATKVDPLWMSEVAPHLCDRRADGVYFRGYRVGSV